MTRLKLLLPLVAAAALAGCNDKSHTIVAGGPDDDDAVNNVALANVQLPPSILDSKSYRCGDNSIVYVDWLSDKKSANIRFEKNGGPTNLTADAEGKPLTGGGYTLDGAFNGSSVKLSGPSGNKSCEA
jgi:hypothetical protein